MQNRNPQVNKMNKDSLKIVFFGTPEFAVASLKSILDDGWNVAAVVTAPDKPAGRGHKLLQSDVKKFALERGLSVLQPVNLKDPDFIGSLRKIDADLFIVIAFRMLPEAVWSMPRLGCFNLHASLLPRYRGAAPINRAIMNGDPVTGVTTFFLKQEIDTGDIIDQRMIAIGENDNAGLVHDRLMEIGADMTLQTVRDIADETLSVTPQPDGEFIPAPKIFRADCEIDWTKSAKEIHDHVRGLSPYPAARTTITLSSGQDIEVKIFDTRLLPEKIGTEPETVVIDGKRLMVAASDRMLEIISLQPSGKKRMEASAFLAGHIPVKCHKSVL